MDTTIVTAFLKSIPEEAALEMLDLCELGKGDCINRLVTIDDICVYLCNPFPQKYVNKQWKHSSTALLKDCTLA